MLYSSSAQLFVLTTPLQSQISLSLSLFLFLCFLSFSLSLSLVFWVKAKTHSRFQFKPYSIYSTLPPSVCLPLTEFSPMLDLFSLSVVCFFFSSKLNPTLHSLPTSVCPSVWLSFFSRYPFSIIIIQVAWNHLHPLVSFLPTTALCPHLSIKKKHVKQRRIKLCRVRIL